AVTSQLPPPAPAIPAFIPKTNIKVYGEDWVLAQPKHNYTLQLLASEDESKVDELIDSKVSPDDLAKISFTRYGNRWYNLVMGSYSSNSQAQAALDNLPAAMKKLNPWIRPISSLQRVIHAEAVTQQKKP
ncbi:MAG: SPOR domain-containing protein, partial [bacterium]